MRRHLLALALLQSVSARLGEPTTAAYSYSFTEPPSAAPTTETRAPTRTESYARVYDVCSTNEPTPTPTRATTTLP